MLKVLLVMLAVVFFSTSACALNLDRIKSLYLSGDYNAAINECERALASLKGHPPEADELYYLAGLSYLKTGNYLRASDIFEIIINEFPGSRYKERAMLGLGDAYFLKGDYAKAIQEYGALANSGSATMRPVALHRLNQCSLRQGNTEEANKYMDSLKKSAPLTTELLIQQESGPLLDYYTVQVGSFSASTNANNLSGKLIQKGYPAFVEEGISHGKTIYRVRVGRFRTRNQAQELERKLSQEGYPTHLFP